MGIDNIEEFAKSLAKRLNRVDSEVHCLHSGKHIYDWRTERENCGLLILHLLSVSKWTYSEEADGHLFSCGLLKRPKEKSYSCFLLHSEGTSRKLIFDFLMRSKSVLEKEMKLTGTNRLEIITSIWENHKSTLRFFEKVGFKEPKIIMIGENLFVEMRYVLSI